MKQTGARRRFRRRQTETAPASPGLIEECERFLEGDLLQGFRGNGDLVPDWVWVNVLAHAGEGELRSLRPRAGSSMSSACMWERTLVFLAGLLLDEADRSGTPLDTLQRQVVVPIELAGVSQISPEG